MTLKKYSVFPSEQLLRYKLFIQKNDAIFRKRLDWQKFLLELLWGP